MPVRFNNIFILFVVSLMAGCFVSSVFADCAEQESVAVFVISGLTAEATLQIETLSVSQVGESVFPSEDDIFQNIFQLFGNDFNPAISPGELVGNMWSWYGASSSSQVLVDRRDGSVVFAGTVVWMGTGQIIAPVSSSHPWSVVSGGPSLAPLSIGIFSDSDWGNVLPDPSILTNEAITYLRTTDVFHSFGECGDYVVSSWVYMPSIGGLEPAGARLIIAVEGKIGAPWNGQSVSVVGTSWGGLKVLFR